MTNQEPEVIEIPQPLDIFCKDLYLRGVEFWRAFKELTSEHEDKNSYVGSFLMAHSLELFLKAYLAAQSVSKNDLKSKSLGHNLEKLYKKCVELDIPDVNNLEIFCKNVYKMNDDHDFRYPNGYILHVPSPGLCQEVMGELMEKIEPITEEKCKEAWFKLHEDYRATKFKWTD